MTGMLTPRVRIVIPYFGEWPFWFDLFLTSCAWNPTIDWLFYTDCGTPDNAPANTAFRNISYADYCRHISETLAIDYAPAGAYKLCDLKPAIGALHAADLDGWDYFGFGDIDVIYGDLAGYLFPRLACCDVLSTHATRISGHLCVMRNTETFRQAFRRAPEWRACFEAPEHWRFDEAQFSKVFLRYKNWPRWLRRIVDGRDPRRRRACFEESYSTPGCRLPWRDGRSVFPDTWYCRPRALTNDRDGATTFPYVHFLAWKRRWRDVANPASLMRVTPADRERGWRLTAQGFLPLEDHEDA